MSDGKADLDALVRRVDEDRWLASRFAPRDVRARLIAVYAVCHEIAKTAESVSDPHMAALRFAWWRDAIEEIGAGKLARAHPAAEALEGAHRQTPLPLAAFTAMIEARARDLEPAPFAAWGEQSAYIDATAGAVIRLALAACGGDVGGAFVRDAGRAWGLAGLLRARAFWEARGRRIFPTEARDSEAAARLMANTALAAHAQARAGARVLPADLFAAFGYVALTPRYLRAPGPGLLSRQLRILGASVTGRL